jgi:hypothetical protein
MFKQLPEVDLSAEDQERLNLRTASVVQNLIYEIDASKGEAAPPKLASLQEQIKEKGGSLRAAAAGMRLSAVIIKSLDKRRPRAGSIPRRLYEVVAEFLGIDVEAVLAYLSMEPVPPSGHYRSASTPSVSQTEFATLITMDPDLSQDDKEYWLAFPPIESEEGIEQDYAL